MATVKLKSGSYSRTEGKDKKLKVYRAGDVLTVSERVAKMLNCEPHTSGNTKRK